jgi:methionyl-tRNA formyltransferase
MLAAGKDEVALVVTQPPRPKGRSLQTTPCPVDGTARAAGLNVITPVNVNAPEVVAQIAAIRPDIMVVIAYGQILRRALLDIPPLGSVNIHASLLPKYRGAAPIEWAVVSGEQVTGVTAMFISERMDAGDIIMTQEVPIAADDTAGTLHDRLAAAGAETLVRVMDLCRAGKAPRRPQDESVRTLAPKLHKEDGRIDWTQPAQKLYDRIRGFNPRPGCFCQVQQFDGTTQTLRVLRSEVVPGQGLDSKPGQVLAADAHGLTVQTGTSRLRLLQVQPEGRGAMTGGAYVCGHHIKPGSWLM